MPLSIPLTKVLSKAGWTVKIYDNEGPEEPHVTIRRQGKSWRVSLRTREFLKPPGGKWSEIPQEIFDALQSEENWSRLQAFWDANNPHNRVNSEDDDN